MDQHDKIPIEKFIDKKKNKDMEVPLPTISNFKVLLDFYGYRLNYNLIKREIEVSQKDESGQYHKVNNSLNNVITMLSDLCLIQGMRLTSQRAYEFLMFVAHDNKYNPIAINLKNCYKEKQSGESQLEKFFSCIEFEGDVGFSVMLFKKWLIQCVAMAHNIHGLYGADGVLVLKAAQGLGKTSIMRKLFSVYGTEYFKESAFLDGTKDTVIENTRYWGTELGEFARSSLKDIDSLKAFITAGKDEFRQPYAVASEKYPRLTVFGATVNDDSFLRDTENRRFWVCEIKSIDLNGLDKVNYLDFWGEVYEIYLQDTQGFRLTPEERELLQKRNKSFKVYSNEEQYILDVLDWEQSREDWKWKTAGQVIDMLGATHLKPVNTGKALNNILNGLVGDVVGVNLHLVGETHQKIKTANGRKLYLVPDRIKNNNFSNPFKENQNYGSYQSRG